MKTKQRLAPLFRTIAVLSLLIIILTGVTFAALQSQQAALTGNTIESATADLRIGTTTSSFTASKVGFDFNGIVPGGSAGPANGYDIYLKNFGSSNLSIKAAISTAPSNLNNIDLNKVFLEITRVDTGYVKSMSLKSLIDGFSSGAIAVNDIIAGGATTQYKLRVSMSSDAFSGSSATISGVDLVFTGVGV